MIGHYGVNSPQVPYQWIWANAAARLAQTVTASQIGFKGFQQDIALEYQLLSISPNRWGPLPDPSIGLLRFSTASNNSVSLANNNILMFAAFGTVTAQNATNASIASRLTRVRNLTAAGAGSIASFRSNTLSGVYLLGGCRFRTQIVLGTVSASMRWFAGMSGTAPVANVSPSSFIDCFGIGRGNGEANLQLFHNDGVGVATQVDLGINFPANTLDSAYEFEIYSLDGINVSYQIINLNTLNAISGIISADLPTLAPLPISPLYYSSNNIDAVQVSLDFANLQFWQRVV